MIKKKPKLSREEINEYSKQLKRKRKHKGLPSGSRLNNNDSNASKKTTQKADPRIGSKKPISLIAPTKVSQPPVKQNTAQPKVKNETPEQKLSRLENDPYLDELLDITESGKALTKKQQNDLDNMLDQIDALMQQLGYSDEEDTDEDSDDFETKENIIGLLKNH